MRVTRLFVLCCAIALSALGCSSSEPSASEPSEPEETTGAEAMPPPEPAPVAEATPSPQPAPAPPPVAAPAAPPQPQMPPLSMVITHNLKDYAAWKPLFDSHEQARKDAGLVGHCVMKDVKKPKSISIWSAYADQAKVDAMLGSEDMKTKMKEAGVVGKPTVVPLKHVAMSPPGDKQPKFGAIIVHSVKDFDAWKTAFDSHDQVRKDAGITGYAVSQDPKDPNTVTVWLEAEEQAKLEEFMKNKDVKAKMKEAGVKGAPKATIYEILEFKMYS
jgi:quinol monooxygenase YgiN